ncbi:TPA: hypothetical protein DEG21_03530 [Patescibacteria group bacterium]|nr:hypothetical protein [Candidatus Gracilibacteria bacterium]
MILRFFISFIVFTLSCIILVRTTISSAHLKILVVSTPSTASLKNAATWGTVRLLRASLLLSNSIRYSKGTA